MTDFSHLHICPVTRFDCITCDGTECSLMAKLANETLTAPTLPPALLRRIGAALYGDYGWQSRLACELDVADRTMRRWLSGEMPVPSGVTDQLYQMALERSEALEKIAVDISPFVYLKRAS